MRQMLLMRKTRPGKVSGIGESECVIRLHNPGGAYSLTLHYNELAGAGRLFFLMDTVSPSKNCASSDVQNAQRWVKTLFVRLPFSSRQPSVLCSSAAAGVSSVHGTGW